MPRSPGLGARSCSPERVAWSQIENDVLVGDYLAMLDNELAGTPYSKAEHRRAVVELIGRSDSSVEFKHRNLSAVMLSIGLPRIKGYLPAWNAQFGGLADALERRLDMNGALLGQLDLRSPRPEADPFVSPPAMTPERKVDRSPLPRLVRKFDPMGRDARNRALGRQGEEFVMEVEERRLRTSGRPDLAKRIEWTSDTRGDGAGYDIASFDAVTGAPRLIEVKTTCGDARTPFYVSRNEESFSRERPDEFRLYRVFDFAARPRIFELRPPLGGAVRLEAANWMASFA